MLSCQCDRELVRRECSPYRMLRHRKSGRADIEPWLDSLETQAQLQCDARHVRLVSRADSHSAAVHPDYPELEFPPGPHFHANVCDGGDDVCPGTECSRSRSSSR